MEQGRPSQSILIGWRDLHLVGDHVGEDPHSLAVASGEPVVLVQRGGERQYVLGGRGPIQLTGRLGEFELLLETSNASRRPQHLHPRRGAIGKDEGESLEGGQRQQTASDPVDQHDHDENETAHHSRTPGTVLGTGKRFPT
jgi:hypothetical protein